MRGAWGVVRGGLLAVAVAAIAAPLAAQNPPPRPDSTRRDTTLRRDSVSGRERGGADSLRARQDSLLRDSLRLHPDSLNPDSMEPGLPFLGPAPGPQPAGHRWIFTDEDIHYRGALSLGEVLSRIPGVFLVRSGWFGAAEALTYAGQGPGSVEVDWDGFVVDPLGLDRGGLDLGRIDIGTLKRIEVEVLPTVLRVHLVSDVALPRRARTEASFQTGDASTNGYRLRYLNRWRGGTGLGVGATYLSTAGPTVAKASYAQLNLWTKATWMPSDHVGAEFQVNTYSMQRDRLSPFSTTSTSPPLPAEDVQRTDLFVRAFGSTHTDGSGLRFDAVLGSSSYTDSTKALDSTLSQASVTVSYRAKRWSWEAWGRMRDGLTPFDAGGRLSWSLTRLLTATAWGRRLTRLGGGGVSEVAGGLEFRPFERLAFHGDLRYRVLQDSQYAIADTAQHVSDWTGGLSWTGERLSFDATIGHHDPYSTPPLGQFQLQLPGVVSAGATVRQVAWRFQPWRSFGFSGYWRDPGTDGVPYEPRNHSVTRATFESRFLPRYRRGVFDLMAQIEIESWGRGVMGATSSGTPVLLPGQTVWNYHLQFRLVGAIIYWTMRNALIARYALVPGFEVPRAISRFGVRWEFTN
jgi:hypothetical protein